MKLLFLLAATVFALSAQSPAAQGYAYFGLDNPAGHNFEYNSVGAGADVFVYKGVAFSPSAGYLFANGNDGGKLAIVTANGSYHFLRGKGPLEPFVTAGYGAYTNFGGGQSMFNYGGGANYWFKKRIAFRAEVLNFQTRNYRELTSIRFGVSFR